MGITDVTKSESFLYALFCIAVVFSVLVILALLVKLFSGFLSAIAPKKKVAPASPAPVAPAAAAPVDTGLKLTNVDEKTAALIMAIVSDETGIPLDQLIFKSIKALD